MKNVKLLSILALTLLLSGNISAQKTILTEAEMPVEIVNYIKENFQKHRILKAVKEMDDDKMEFEIKLSKKVELEFDERFQIKEIEVKNGIPLHLIPLPVAKYVQSHYPDLKVVQWKFKKEGQKIKLDNKLKILFDKNGNFMKTEAK